MSENKVDDGDSFDLSKFVQINPEISSLVSKYIPHPHRTPKRNNQGDRRINDYAVQGVRSASYDRSKKNNDAELQLRMLPDLRAATDMLIDAIISPGDMVSTEVSVECNSTAVTSELGRAILEPIREYFDKDYDLKKEAPEHLRRALVTEGSSPVMVVPENVVDAIINSGSPLAMESLSKVYDDNGMPRPIGILGHVRRKARQSKLAMENFRQAPGADRIDQRLSYGDENDELLREDSVIITDNLAVMKTRLLMRRKREIATRNIYASSGGLSLENYRPQIDKDRKRISDLQVERAISRQRTNQVEMIAELPSSDTAKRRSIGKPMIFNLPSESVIPLHVPSDPSSHVGYLIVLDEEGYPIRRDDSINNGVMSSNGGSITTSNSLGSNILNRTANNLINPSGFNVRGSSQMDAASRMYADIFERDLIARLKNGAYNQNVQITKSTELMRVMFARLLQSKLTQVLFVSLEHMTYVAFDYHENGVGRSILDEGSVVNTTRTTLLYADWLANIRNSIGRTTVTMSIDEEDPDPDSTIATGQNWFARNRSIEPPNTVNTPAEITNFLQTACVDWVIESEHPGIPKIKTSVEQKNTNYTSVSSELRDELKKMSIQLTGLSPEQVDNSLAGEFATTVVANNIRLSKLVSGYQSRFIPQISDLVRKIIRSTPELIEKIFSVAGKNVEQIKYKFNDVEEAYYAGLSEEKRREQLVFLACEKYIEDVCVTLPKPPSVTLENQLAQLQTYIEALDLALNEAFMKEEALDSSIIGEASTSVPAMKAHVRALFIRRQILRLGLLPELQELVAVDDDGNPQVSVFDESIRHTESLVKSLVRTSARTAPLAAAATADLARINESAQGSGDAGDTGGDDTGGGDMGDDGAGSDDSADGMGDFGI